MRQIVSLSSLLLQLLFLGPLAPIFAIGLLEHVFAGDFGLQFGTDEERAPHLPVERISLLWGRDKSVSQHDRDQTMDLFRGALGAEVKWLLRRKSLSQDENSI